jgi:CDP-2,3-bis-(O-geranylgeranyl)-sn-glycerol synthase
MWLTPEQLSILFLLIVANGSPLLAAKLFRGKGHPLDGGRNFHDGRPLFGSSKTVRGIVAAVTLTPLVSVALGTGWQIGLAIGLFAMLGDLFSSFIKRRLGMAPSSRAPGLDQIPESLFPLLACRTLVELSTFQIMLLVLLFFAGGMLLSRLAFHLGLRKHPY